MSKNQMEAKIEELLEYEALIEEAEKTATEIRNEIKQEMIDRDVDELNVGKYFVRWTDVATNRFNTAEFKKLYGDLYKAFTKTVHSKRFSIA